MRYMDESGFCLNPCIPYGSPELGAQLELKSQKSNRLNVLGFFSRDNQLEPYTFECSINRDVVISCIDDFCLESQEKNSISNR